MVTIAKPLILLVLTWRVAVREASGKRKDRRALAY